MAPPDRFEAFYWPDEAAEIAIERLNGRRLRRGWLRVYMPEVGSSRELVDEFGRRGRDERPVRFVVYIWLIDRSRSMCLLRLQIGCLHICPRCIPQSAGRHLRSGHGLHQSPIETAVLCLETGGSVLPHGRKRGKCGAVATRAPAWEAAIAGEYRSPVSSVGQQTRGERTRGWVSRF